MGKRIDDIESSIGEVMKELGEEEEGPQTYSKDLKIKWLAWNYIKWFAWH